MAHCRKEWNDYFEKMVTRLAEKVVKGGLDEYTTRLKEVHLKENVLSMVLKDEFGDEIDCRMVFPASQSIQYAPQTTVRVDTVRIAEHQELAVRQKPKLMSLKDNSEQVKKKYSLKDLPEGLVTKPKITEYNGKMFVCCHINGKRQTPAPLQPEEWKKYLASNSNDKTELAIAHFQREIGKAMNRLEDVTRDEKRGLGR